MSTKSIRIMRNEATFSYEANCPDCKKQVFMVTDEAIRNGPRRESGSSLLLPAMMTASHECDTPPQK